MFCPNCFLQICMCTYIYLDNIDIYIYMCVCIAIYLFMYLSGQIDAHIHTYMTTYPIFLLSYLRLLDMLNFYLLRQISILSAVCVNKVLLEYNHTCEFVPGQRLLLRDSNRIEQLWETKALKYLLSGPLQKKFASPVILVQPQHNNEIEEI